MRLHGIPCTVQGVDLERPGAAQVLQHAAVAMADPRYQVGDEASAVAV